MSFGIGGTSIPDPFSFVSVSPIETITFQATPNAKPFLKQTSSVIGVFTAVGVVVLAIIVLVYLRVFRHRRFVLQIIRVNKNEDSRGRARGERGRGVIITPFTSTLEARADASLSTSQQGGGAQVLAGAHPNLSVQTDQDGAERADAPANTTREQEEGDLVGVQPNLPVQTDHEGVEPSEPPPSYSSAFGSAAGSEAGSDSASQVSVSDALATASPGSPGNNTEKAAAYR